MTRLQNYSQSLTHTASSWWLSLRWAVATFSTLVALALAGSFVPYERVIAQGHPWLPPKTCLGCPMCGMTRAFCAMSSGRWSEAADLNPFGPLAYCLAWAWLVLCLLFVARAAYKLHAGFKMSGNDGSFMSSATLRVISGPRQGQSLPLAESPQTIGREAGCDITLDGYDGVSRQHARLWCENGEWMIQDLGSTNGLRVNGQSIRQAVLQLPCRLQLGDFIAELTVNSSPASAPAQRTASRRGRSRWIVGGAIGMAVVAFGAWAISGPDTDTPNRETRLPATLQPGTSPVLPDESGTMPDALPTGPPADPQIFESQNNRPSTQALQAAKSATVMVVTRDGNSLGFGSAFLAGDAQHIVTNRHVVVSERAGRVKDCLLVFNSGTARETKLEVRADQITLAPASGGEEDFTSDLAVIRLDQSVPSTLAAPLAIGRSEELSEADTIHVLGFPLGVGTLTLDDQLPSVSVKAVTVERVQRRAASTPNAGTPATGTPDAGEIATVLQIGGTVTQGNSGGPVINNRGEVVGVISRGADGTGMAYAIPTTFVRALLP